MHLRLHFACERHLGDSKSKLLGEGTRQEQFECRGSCLITRTMRMSTESRAAKSVLTSPNYTPL